LRRDRPSPRLATEKPRTEKRAAGDAAEAAAAEFLQARGLRVLARNANFKVGEIDLVLRDRDTIVFCEVRLRAPSRFGDGAESVGSAKRRKLARAAEAWLLKHPLLADEPCRFDVVSVAPAPGGLACDWIAGAFTLDDL
jgi:putative endonuclease